MVAVKSFMVPREKFVTVERDTDAQTAARIMRDRGIGSLFVTNGKEIIGILTDTDMVRRVVATGADTHKTTVEQVMSAPIMTIEENKTLLDANDLMAKTHIRHLGVTQDGKLVGHDFCARPRGVLDESPEEVIRWLFQYSGYGGCGSMRPFVVWCGRRSLAPSDLIYPLFVVEGRDRREEIASMPGQFRLSVDLLVKEAGEIAALGIPAIILFGIPDRKDDRGSSGFDPNGIVQRAVKAVKNQVPELLVVTDVCIDEYTDHGHCGIVKDGRILNDETLECLRAMARTHAQAGADMVAPSDMMDGRVAAIRADLDQAGFPELPIMAYAANLHPAFMHRFGTRRFQVLNSAIGNPTRWILPIAVKRFGKSRSMSKKGPTSLW